LGTFVLEEKWPVLGRHERAAGWLRMWADLGRAPRTIDAYARGLAEYVQVCERTGVDPVTAGRADVAAYVRELTGGPTCRLTGKLLLPLQAGHPEPGYPKTDRTPTAVTPRRGPCRRCTTSAPAAAAAVHGGGHRVATPNPSLCGHLTWWPRHQ